jgi:Archaeal Type IV pilin, N-terminal
MQSASGVLERHPFGRRRARRRWSRANGRGVSDVVATILLLALTVTLFASIFAWVTTFPSPPAQNNNQFQASLVYTSNSTYVSGIRILHLAGPAVAGTSQIFLKSSTQPAATEFLNPYTVSSETLAYATVKGFNTWNLGQVWNLTFSSLYMPRAGGNITIYIVASSELLFSVILPGTSLGPPPTIVSTSISPANPWQGEPFTVYATLAGTYNANSVYVNLATVVPSLSTPQQMTQNAQGQWTFLVSTGAPNNGTFYGFVNASNGAGQQASGVVVITISNTGGGGSTGPLISVGVVAVPQPPTVVVSTNYFAAVVTYSGKLTEPLNVSFWVNQTPSFPFQTHERSSTHFNGPSTLKISGPSTVTVYGTWPNGGAFSAWLLNSSVWINASASIATVGSASGTNLVSTPSYVQGIVFSTVQNPSHSCSTGSSGTCPYVEVTVWDNWTSPGLGGPSSVTFSGTVYANFTTGAMTKVSQAIGSTSVSASSFTTVTTTIGGTTRWKPAQSGSYVLTVVLTVLSGTTVVGYIYDTYTGTAS